MPASARRGKMDATAAGPEERNVMAGRDRGGEVAAEDARRWSAASSERTAGREPEADAGEAEAEGGPPAPPSSSTSISSASMGWVGWGEIAVGTGESGYGKE